MSKGLEFNKQADLYAKYRPRYPGELYEFLAQLCPKKELALDVGTGNGQCALDLAAHFNQVIATDPSAEQIAKAIPHARVKYHVAYAQDSVAEKNSVDLITAATAAHWFDLPAFYQECRRVGRGNIALWTYGWHESESAEVTSLMMKIGKEILLPYWSEQPKKTWNGYRDLDFSFPKISAPDFHVTTQWTLEEFLGYLSTWSASQKYRDQNGSHPAQTVLPRLETLFGDHARKIQFEAKLHLLVGSLG